MTNSFYRHVLSVKCEAHKFAIWEEMRRRERGEGWKLIKINTAHYNVFSSTQTQDYVYRFFTIEFKRGRKCESSIGWNSNNNNSFNSTPPKEENRKLLTGAKKSDVYVWKVGCLAKKTPSPSFVCNLYASLMNELLWTIPFVYWFSSFYYHVVLKRGNGGGKMK